MKKRRTPYPLQAIVNAAVARLQNWPARTETSIFELVEQICGPSTYTEGHDYVFANLALNHFHLEELDRRIRIEARKAGLLLRSTMHGKVGLPYHIPFTVYKRRVRT